jgi:pimeloyl-ACP methyl ester carboxylesterase
LTPTLGARNVFAVRTDFDPASTQRAAIREGLAILAQGILLPFGYLPSRHRSIRKKDIRTLVFVHGLKANRASFFPLQAYLQLNGHRRQYSFNYPARGSIESLAIRLRDEIDRNVRGGRIDLICHSMGGLVARFYVQELGGSRRVDRVITLGTPHHGTHASLYLPTVLASQMKPEGPFIEHLNRLPPPPSVAFSSFAGGKDIIVLPRSSALCPFGQARMIDNLGHMSLLLSPIAFSAVRDALASASS